MMQLTHSLPHSIRSVNEIRKISTNGAFYTVLVGPGNNFCESIRYCNTSKPIYLSLKILVKSVKDSVEKLEGSVDIIQYKIVIILLPLLLFYMNHIYFMIGFKVKILT